MKNKLQKVLLIDDKKSHQNGCGYEFYNKLPTNLKHLIQFEPNINSILPLPDNGKHEFLSNIDNYWCILIHTSFAHMHPFEHEFEFLKEQIPSSKLIQLTGGGMTANSTNKRKSITRNRVFSNLNEVLHAYKKTGFNCFNALFDSAEPLQGPLLNRLSELLKESKSAFLKSEELKTWLSVLKEIPEKVINNYQNKSLEELTDKIPEWRKIEIEWSH